MLFAVWVLGYAARADVERPDSLTLGRLLEMSPEQLADVGICEMYLLCMEGLPGASTEIKKSYEEFSLWAVEKLHPPIEGGDLEKAQALGKILKLYLEAERTPLSPRLAYVALGRRLGYPLKFASGRNGLCILWEGEKTKFEVADFDVDDRLSTGSAFSVEHPSWRFEVNAALGELQQSGYSRVLSPKDELSVLLGMRAQVLESARLNAEALVAFSQAHQLSPGCLDHMQGIRRVAEKITPLVGSIGPLQVQEPRENRLNEIDRLNRMNALESEISTLQRLKNQLRSDQTDRRGTHP